MTPIIVIINFITTTSKYKQILYNKQKNSVVKMIPYGESLWSWKLVEVNIDNNEFVENNIIWTK